MIPGPTFDLIVVKFWKNRKKVKKSSKYHQKRPICHDFFNFLRFFQKDLAPIEMNAWHVPLFHSACFAWRFPPPPLPSHDMPVQSQSFDFICPLLMTSWCKMNFICWNWSCDYESSVQNLTIEIQYKNHNFSTYFEKNQLILISKQIINTKNIWLLSFQ